MRRRTPPVLNLSRSVGALAAALLAGPMVVAAPAGNAYDAPASSLPAPVKQHVDMAYMILKGDVSKRFLPAVLNPIDGAAFPDPMRQARDYARLPATRVFDQLYYLGTPIVSAWALNTSGGIILIDTLDNTEEAKSYIEDGLRSVHLDPANIKYILLSHGHSDHYGGAKYLAEKYHARVLMSPADWAFAARLSAGAAVPGRPVPVPAPTHDIDIADGQRLALGGTALRLYLTPGHTPGTVSAIFPVTDHGRPHMVSFLGGVGMAPIDKDPAHGAFRTLRDSMTRFANLSLDAGADVVISCHPFMDDAWEKADAIRHRRSGAANSFVAGTDAVWRYYAATIEAVDAAETYFQLNPPRTPAAPET